MNNIGSRDPGSSHHIPPFHRLDPRPIVLSNELSTKCGKYIDELANNQQVVMKLLCNLVDMLTCRENVGKFWQIENMLISKYLARELT